MREYGQFPRWRSLTALTVTAVFLVIAVHFTLIPLKIELSKRYVSRGDSYFNELQLKGAQQEYRNALNINPQSSEANDNLQLAEATSHDLKAGLPFFLSHHDDDIVARIKSATQPFPTPKAALIEGVALYSSGEYRYARYPLERAVQLDPEYPEAWNYLALTYRELAKQDPEMQTKAENAEAKRDSLSVKYIQPTH